MGKPISIPEAYWNGEPCKARVVDVIVGEVPVKTWWCYGLTGQTREAVEVRYAGQEPFYLDNEDGTALYKVTKGRGSPWCGHKSLPVERLANTGDHQ